MSDTPFTPGGAAPDGRISAPAALRNRAAITTELQRLAPKEGRALEIASGTGEHIVHFAKALPNLTWQPSDPDPARHRSISAWAALDPSPKLCAPIDLDASRPGWSADHGPADLILLANLLHLITDAQVAVLLSEIAHALAPQGIALIYGPFLRDGEATSPGDAAFHEGLRAQNPEIGYKDVIDIAAGLVQAGLAHVETVRMPANNLLLCFEAPAVTSR